MCAQFRWLYIQLLSTYCTYLNCKWVQIKFLSADVQCSGQYILIITEIRIGTELALNPIPSTLYVSNTLLKISSYVSSLARALSCCSRNIPSSPSKNRVLVETCTYHCTVEEKRPNWFFAWNAATPDTFTLHFCVIYGLIAAWQAQLYWLIMSSVWR